MTSKHTPGPWKVEEYTAGDSMFGFSPACAVMCRDDNKVVCEIPDYTVGQFDREDARLIAAAPELLEALIRLESELVEDKYGNDYEPSPFENLAVARAAIAKATGESA